MFHLVEYRFEPATKVAESTQFDSRRSALRLAGTILRLGLISTAGQEALPSMHMICASTVSTATPRRTLTSLRKLFPAQPTRSLETLSAHLHEVRPHGAVAIAVPRSAHQPRLIAHQLTALATAVTLMAGCITRLRSGEVLILASFKTRQGAIDHIAHIQATNSDDCVIYGPSSGTWASTALPALIKLSRYHGAPLERYVQHWVKWIKAHPTLSLEFAQIEQRWDQLLLSWLPKSRHHVPQSAVTRLCLRPGDLDAVVAFLERHAGDTLREPERRPAGMAEVLLGLAQHPDMMLDGSAVRAASRIARRASSKPLGKERPTAAAPRPAPIPPSANVGPAGPGRTAAPTYIPPRRRPPPPAQRQWRAPKYKGPVWIGSPASPTPPPSPGSQKT